MGLADSHRIHGGDMKNYSGCKNLYLIKYRGTHEIRPDMYRRGLQPHERTTSLKIHFIDWHSIEDIILYAISLEKHTGYTIDGRYYLSRRTLAEHHPSGKHIDTYNIRGGLQYRRVLPLATSEALSFDVISDDSHYLIRILTNTLSSKLPPEGSEFRAMIIPTKKVVVLGNG